MVERWASADALRVHGKAEALTALGGRLAGKVAGAPVVKRLAPVPAGDGEKGAV
jgi:quinol monooxygenase YgiN